MTPRQKLGKARVRTFDFVPYLASYIYQLREQESPGIGTAAVDKAGNLYWDPAFVQSQDLDQLAYTVTHESLHLVFSHCHRAREVMGNAASEQQRYVWNVACDLVVEQTLACMRAMAPANIVALGVTDPRLGFKLDFPPNQTADVYYRLINERLREQEQQREQERERRRQEQQQQADEDEDQDESDDEDGEPDDAEGDDEQGDGDQTGDESDGDEQDDGQPDGDGEPGDDDGDGSDGEPDADADGDQPGDEAGEPDADGDGEQDGDDDGDDGDGDWPCPGGSAADGCDRPYEVPDDGNWDNLAADTAAAATEQAIQEYEAAHGIGSVPGSLKESLNAKLHPQPDPFDRLRSAVCSSVASPVGGRDLSYRRQSRRQGPGPQDPLLHGRVTVAPNAVVIVDTSGSMGYPEIKERCLTVVAQGLAKLRSVRVVCADTALRSDAMLTSLARFEWAGGGGTSMDEALEEVDRKYHPDSIVIVTDAETAWPARATRARVVVAAVCRADSHYFKAIPTWCKKVCMIQEGGA